MGKANDIEGARAELNRLRWYEYKLSKEIEELEKQLLHENSENASQIRKRIRDAQEDIESLQPKKEEADRNLQTIWREYLQERRNRNGG